MFAGGVGGLALAAPRAALTVPFWRLWFLFWLFVWGVLPVRVVVVSVSSPALGVRWFFCASRSAAARLLWRLRAARRWWRGRAVGSSVPSSRVPVGCLRWLVAPRWGASRFFVVSVLAGGRRRCFACCSWPRG